MGTKRGSGPLPTRENVNAYQRKWIAENPDKYRNTKLKLTYNITLKDYEKMLEMQNSECKICGKQIGRFTKGTHIDHDHSTGKVRALLCRKCNVLLGALETGIGPLLNRFLEYIAKDGQI